MKKYTALSLLFRSARRLGPVAMCLVLLSCGGGTGGSGSASVPNSYIAVVEQVHVGFDDPSLIFSANTVFLVDGQSAPQPPQLNYGELALVAGIIDDPGTDSSGAPTGAIHADRVEISHPVVGTVDAVDASHARLVVEGLDVFLDGRTYIESAGGNRLNLAAISAGDYVAVSGHPASSGRVAATLVAVLQPSAVSTVTGFVSSVDANLRTLTIGGLAVDFSAASLSGFSGAAPQVGDYVRIVGTRPAVASPLETSSIQYLAPLLTAHAPATVLLHGVVTAIDGSQFAVDGLPVSLPGDDMGCGPPVNPPALPPLDSLVQVDGVLASGTVTTRKWSTESPPGWGENFLSVTGTVDAVDPAFGTLSVLGFTIQPSFTTPVMLAEASQYLPWADVHVGDRITAQGGAGLDEQVLPDFVTRDPSPFTPSVYAVYDLIGIADPLVYVAGRPIATDANTQYSYISPVGNPTAVPMTRALFFSNPHYFPFWDRICTPSMNFVVRQNADGSLTAVSILWEPDYC